MDASSAGHGCPPGWRPQRSKGEAGRARFGREGSGGPPPRPAPLAGHVRGLSTLCATGCRLGRRGHERAAPVAIGQGRLGPLLRHGCRVAGCHISCGPTRLWPIAIPVRFRPRCRAPQRVGGGHPAGAASGGTERAAWHGACQRGNRLLLAVRGHTEFHAAGRPSRGFAAAMEPTVKLCRVVPPHAGPAGPAGGVAGAAPACPPGGPQAPPIRCASEHHAKEKEHERREIVGKE